MSVYQKIASLNLSQEERTSLRVLFTNNPSKKTQAEEIIPTCNNEELVEYLKGLLTSERSEHQELGKKRKAREENFKKRPKPTLPQVNELADFLERPLPEDLKIPLPQYEFDCLVSNNFEDLCTFQDLDILFRVSEIEHSFSLYSKFVSAPLWNNPPSNVGTEYLFVSFWDINIRYPLELLLPDGNSVRNISKHMSTNKDWPDYGFLLSNTCPFRGEEKSFLNDEDPRAELKNKLVWTYDPAPYVLGHGKEVDIWGVGRLITDASGWITGLSHEIVELGERMQSNNKPSVYEALNFLKSLIR